MRVTVVRFPGSNCDHDVEHVYAALLNASVETIWHKERDLKNPDLVILPGGFSFGDYLRTGALARVSPIMEEVKKFSDTGGKLIGICNGFQILCECGLLPGVLLRNINRKFLSRYVNIKVENNLIPFTSKYENGEIITCPVAHGEGNYFIDPENLKALEGDGLVVFRYCDPNGNIDHENFEINPNGSMNSIAGISNKKGNILGLMPHPERAAESIVGNIGNASGLKVFESCLVQ
ncbi:MAG: phosphoribosylformylglycinamidine synthase subunit PurQ [bacterium]|nr:phosphoribosylformylglycinamidine synthase subunit PurQ [bacterium]